MKKTGLYLSVKIALLMTGTVCFKLGLIIVKTLEVSQRERRGERGREGGRESEREREGEREREREYVADASSSL